MDAQLTGQIVISALVGVSSFLIVYLVNKIDRRLEHIENIVTDVVKPNDVRVSQLERRMDMAETDVRRFSERNYTLNGANPRGNA